MSLDDFEKDEPIVDDFFAGVKAEKEHQRKRWGDVHDRNKTGAEWYWLVGYLAGKALYAMLSGDTYKAKHHTISAAAALAHWHDAISQGARDESKSSDVERLIAEHLVERGKF